MSNIAAVLKAEISRLARREVRAEIESLKKASAQHRSQIAALRREVQALEQQLKRVGKGAAARAGARAAAADEGEGAAKGLRFSAKGLAAQRKRLGLSAAQVGKLLGVSPLSVYKWESGSTRPRAKQIEAIASLRAMGRRDVAVKLGLPLRRKPKAPKAAPADAAAPAGE